MGAKKELTHPSITVIGSGSWATALIKILLENHNSLTWYIRRKEQLEFIQSHRHNPTYLTDVVIPTDKIYFTNSIEEAIQKSTIIFLVTPAAFIKNVLEPLSPTALQDKYIVSAIKGIIPVHNLLITDYLKEKYQCLDSSIAVIGGPCHAEEIAMEKQSYLTIASHNIIYASQIADFISNKYVKTIINQDPIGLEYTAILKNIISIACGMAHGLFYGDNFHAVLVSNGIKEIASFLENIALSDTRNILHSGYIGDLMVTAYSQFSRNRTFGTMIGKGYTVQSAQLEMNMIAEGYFAVQGIYQLIQEKAIQMPITEMVYRVLYEKKSVAKEMKKLVEMLQ